MIRKLILMVMFPLACGAQAYHYDGNVTQAKNVLTGAQAPVYTVPNAIITVCGNPPSSSPCTNTVPIFSDQALSIPIPQPFRADSQGRFGFWVSQGFTGSYSVQSPQGADLGTFSIAIPGTGAISLVEDWVSRIGCPQNADGVTGNLWGTDTPANDAGPCVNAWLASHVVCGKTAVVLHQDGMSASSGISGPACGGFTITSDVKPDLAVTNITAISISSNVVTFTTTPNVLSAGQGVVINGIAPASPCHFLVANNGMRFRVLPGGLTATQFRANYPGTTSDITCAATPAMGFSSVGNGFFQIVASPGHMIANGPATNAGICPGGYMDPGYNQPYSSLPSKGQSVSLVNLFLNGNMNFVAPPTGSFVLGQPYCYNTGIAIQNIDGVKLGGNYLYNVNNYNIFLRNTSHVDVGFNTLSPYGPGVPIIEANLDGIHADAPMQYFKFHHNTIASGDDATALNAPEGWPGVISDGEIVANICAGSLSCGRIYTNSTAPPTGYPQPHVDRVLVSGWTGTYAIVPFIIGNEGTTPKPVLDTMSEVYFTNDHLSSTPYAGTAGFAGSGIVLSENIRDIHFSDVTVDGIYTYGGNGGPGLFNTTDGPTINLLDISNVSCGRSAAGFRCSSIVDTIDGYYSSGGNTTINKLSIQNAKATDLDETAWGAIPSAVYTRAITGNTTTIGSLSYSGIDRTNIADIAYTPSTIGTVFAPGGDIGGLLSTNSIVFGAGAGMGATFQTFNGTDSGHNILFTTGTSPTSAGVILTTTFRLPRGHASFCALQPSTQPAAQLNGAQRPLLVSNSATSYILYAGTTALAASTQYGFAVVCN